MFIDFFMSCKYFVQRFLLLLPGTDSFENVLETFRLAKRDLGEILSACEYADQATLDAVFENLSIKSPIEQTFPFYMMIETSGSNSKHDEEKLSMFLEKAMEKQYVADGTIASQPSHIKVALTRFQIKKLCYFHIFNVLHSTCLHVTCLPLSSTEIRLVPDMLQK